MAVRRWVPIVLGVLAVLVLGIIALAGSCAYAVRQQVAVTSAASVGDFEREAEGILKRFPGRSPIVVSGAAGPEISRKALSDRRARGGSIANLHVLAFSPRERTLVRLTVPMWVLRLSPDGRMDINRDEVGLDNLRLSIDDVASAGPGPLFLRKSSDSRVLVWTE